MEETISLAAQQDDLIVRLDNLNYIRLKKIFCVWVHHYTAVLIEVGGELEVTYVRYVSETKQRFISATSQLTVTTTERKQANSDIDQFKMDWKAFITPCSRESSKEGRRTQLLDGLMGHRRPTALTKRDTFEGVYGHL